MAEEEEDQETLRQRALNELLKAVAKSAGTSSTNALKCAEAYAWIRRPDQSHGGGSTGDKR